MSFWRRKKHGTKHVNRYYDEEFVAARVKARRQRALVGGMWDEIGALQFEYVRDHGLAPDMRFLDVGCGCLRGGVHFIRYLDAGRYYGIDLSQHLLDAGFKTELAQAGLQQKLPRENLRCTDGFDASEFGVDFDMALALSVFTHLTLNHLRLCLIRLGNVVKPGGQFFVTVFHSPDTHDWSQPLLHSPGDKTTYPDRDPYHYCRDDLLACARALPWRLERLEQWRHPRDQWMVVFVRSEDSA